MQIQITDTISLIPFSPKRSEEVFSLIEKNREELGTWLEWVSTTQSVDDIIKYAKKNEDDYEKTKSMNMHIIDNGQVIGTTGFTKIDMTNKSATIGYWLDKDSSGKGIMTKSVSKMIDYGFENFVLNRIEVKTAEENTQSRAVIERLSFKFEGISREDMFLNNKFHNHAIYSLLKREWIKIKQSTGVKGAGAN